jgi:hypothetical protein
MQQSFSSEAEFWPFYLREHSRRTTRLMHVFGTSLGFVLLILAVLTMKLGLLILALIAGYGFAWAAHLFIEKNRPATFSAPLWSLKADIRMWFYWLTGRLEAELRRYDIRD